LHAWRTQPLDGIIEQLIERGVAINGVYKCNAVLSFRHVALEAVATLKHATALGLMVHCSCAEAIELLVKHFEADVNAVSDDALAIHL
jgi:primosomal replication protein N